MYCPTLALGAFGRSEAATSRAIVHVCIAVAEINRDTLIDFPDAASLYAAARADLLVYRDDAHVVCDAGEHRFVEDRARDIVAALHDGQIECRGALAWRLAELWIAGELEAKPWPELRADGEPRRCHICSVEIGRGQTWHTSLRRADGRLEDPAGELEAIEREKIDARRRFEHRVLARSLGSHPRGMALP